MRKDKKLYSLKTLLGWFIGSFVIIFVLGSIALLLLTRETRQQMISLSQGLASVLVAEQMQISILNFDRYGVLYSVTGGDQYLRLQEDSGKRILYLLEVAKQIEDPGTQGVVTQTKLKAEQYFRTRKEWQLQGLTPREFVEKNRPLMSQLLNGARKLTRMDLDQAQLALTQASSLFKASTSVNFAILTVFIISVFFFFIFTNRYFFVPMQVFTNYLNRFALEKKVTDFPSQKSQEAQAIAQSLKTQTQYIANEEKRRLGHIAGVAHDLRSPLSAILSSFELVALVLPKDTTDTSAENAIESGKHEIEKIRMLIDEFLDASKIQAGELALNIESCELSSLLHKVVDQWKEMESKRVFNMEVDTVHTKCDISRIERVFHNLLSNAVKYSEEETPIHIKFKKKSQNWAHLIVEDFGTGIHENELEEIFLPFKRSKFVDDMAKGTGLGLSNIKMTIEAHGGKVWAESEIGKGSQFHVHIPIIPG